MSGHNDPLDPKDIDAYLTNLNDLAREAGGAYYVRRERKGDCNMTDEILKKVDEYERFNAFLADALGYTKQSNPMTKALRVAVEHLHTDAFGITAKEYISGKRCLDPVDGLRQIAKILGVKEREK
mgnify:FL=1